MVLRIALDFMRRMHNRITIERKRSYYTNCARAHTHVFEKLELHKSMCCCNSMAKNSGLLANIFSLLSAPSSNFDVIYIWRFLSFRQRQRCVQMYIYIHNVNWANIDRAKMAKETKFSTFLSHRKFQRNK